MSDETASADERKKGVDKRCSKSFEVSCRGKDD